MSVLDPRVAEHLEKLGITYKEIPCDPELADTAAFCEHYGYKPSESANTIIVASRTDPVQFVACVVLATTKLDVNKVVRKLMGTRKLSFATAEQAKELTGMLIGGVTAVGLPDDLPIYIDSRVMEQPHVILGGGNRSSKILLQANELTKLPKAAVIENLAILRTA